MAKTIFEELGGKYERQGDCLLPWRFVRGEQLPSQEERRIMQGYGIISSQKWLKKTCRKTSSRLRLCQERNAKRMNKKSAKQ